MTEYYTSRYKKKSILDWWHKLLIKILRSISKSKFSRILNPLDDFEVSNLEKSKGLNKFFLKHSKKKIKLRKIEFSEVIELDNLETASKQILRIIRKNKFYTVLGKDNNLSASEITDIKNKLLEFKTSYKSWSQGKLFSVSNEKKNKDSDLFESVSFSYFKTSDNLLILNLAVTPSKVFFKKLKNIVNNKTIPNDHITISHFKDFLKTKRIIKGFRTAGNIKEKGFQNLIFDLNFQLNKNFLQDLGGVFSGNNNTNPFIAYFNSKSKLDYKELNKGFGIIDTYGISDIFYDQNRGYYAINYWYESKKNKGLYIIAENDGFPSEYNSDKRINQYYFSLLIFKSWATLHYLKFLNSKIKNLRKSIYQFINTKHTIKFREQIKLKTKLSRKKIRFQRIGREFNTRNINSYFFKHSYDSSSLRAVNSKWQYEINYFSFIKENIEWYIKEGEEQLFDLDKYFKEISSINLIKLNYKFQLVATFLATLGLILALTNAQEILSFIEGLWSKLLWLTTVNRQ